MFDVWYEDMKEFVRVVTIYGSRDSRECIEKFKVLYKEGEDYERILKVEITQWF